MSFRVLALTFHHQFSPVDLVAPSQVPDVMLHQIGAARKNLLLLGSRVLRGSQPVISSSQASSGASVCVVRSRNCAVRQTSDKVLESDGFCVIRCCTIFSPTRKGNAGAAQHIEQEKYPQRSRQHPSIRTPSDGLFLVPEATRACPRKTPPFFLEPLCLPDLQYLQSRA